jgi:surface antigen
MKNLISKFTLSVLTLSLMAQAQTVKAASRGNMAAATLGGVILGGLIGASIAQNFDDNDNRQAQGMWNQALSGQFNNSPYSFQGNQHRGRLIFTAEGYFDGFYCRVYRSEIWDSRSNSPMVTTGYVCRNGDGSWFRKEPGQVMEARRDRPDRGRRFDPPQQPMGPQRGGGMPGGRQQGNGRGNGGGNYGFGSPGSNYGQDGGGNSNTGTSTGTVLTNGDALPISTGVN